MKCSECAEYEVCRRKYDLRIRRRRCDKADGTKNAAMEGDIMTRIAELEAKVPRWIPVTEKIPPDQEEVLLLTRSKNGVRNVDKGYWAIDHFIHRGRSEVTHWMPLPEAPEENKA